ncbi:MAG: bifunctional diaminohydroxyphosphoribosylaminopyrimidine deaminase/5-amino-6-(5-phosphoribosylamino)uracil reductase RibD [Chloroflexi bacterium]|nr:bifunctional diaminohydroxyphosphoribosylaminopyrimidine deaminase/5-amino-6-(5-phosphoribosylamino)uracil reductase RibD [Chloroflexota bacterium]
MRIALRLARRGLGKTSPNPMVGAVIVRDGRIIGRGYHRYYGGPHAEIDALSSATESVEGATVYITLEPCSHQGKTPPCVDALARHRVGRVVAGSLDPNPLVKGRGMEILKKQGIDTRVGVLEGQCRALNEAHFKYMTTGLPLVTIKFAQTLDGRIATATRSSRWISSPQFQRVAHRLRATHDAILIGVGTVQADDPELTVRLVRGRNPVRVVLDSGLRIPMEARVIAGKEAATIVASTRRADTEKMARLRERGVEVLLVGEDEAGEVDIKQLLKMLGGRGITSVLVEGGGRVITSILRQRLADRIVAAIAPKIMGSGIEAVGELNIGDVAQTLKLSFEKVRRVGEDVVIEARFEDERSATKP